MKQLIELRPASPLPTSLTRRFGGKGRHLYDLIQAGFLVPTTFVLPFNEAARFSADELESVRAEIRELLANNPQATWAVRSSVSKEDGADHSFAGLFESFLALKNESEIFESLLGVLDSQGTDRVRQYCANAKISVDELRVAVVLQIFIEADYSGVCFSVSPLTGNDQEILLEMIPGRGDRLVSGLVSPSRWILSWLAEGPLVTHFEGSPINVSDVLLQKIRGLAREIQAHFGSPQDIEFVTAGNQILLVQSRPITKVQFARALGQWTTADLRDGGVSSGVPCPLMASLYHRSLGSAMAHYMADLKLTDRVQIGQAGIEWTRLFYGRLYWNLTASKNVMKQLPGYRERAFDEDMGIRPEYVGDGEVTKVTPLGVLKAIPVLLALQSLYKNHVRQVSDRFQEVTTLTAKVRANGLTDLSPAQFAKMTEELLFEIYPRMEEFYFRTIFLASAAKQDFKVHFDKAEKLGAGLSYARLLAGLGDLAFLQPTKALSQIAEHMRRESLTVDAPSVKQDLVHFFEKFGHHSVSELDLREPRWIENPEFILNWLDQILKHPPNLSAKSSDESELAKAEAWFQRQWWAPWKKNSFFKTLAQVRLFVGLREEVRDHSTQLYGVIRQVALETARRLHVINPELEWNRRIFNLTDFDLVKATARLSDLSQRDPSALQEFAKELAELADQRELYPRAYRLWPAQNELGVGVQGSKRNPDLADIEWTGIPSSQGVYQGPARIIRKLEDAKNLQSGDVLVAVFTDPGWTPLFLVAKAVVLETGGQLSHAAVISREYGIPSVLGIEGITELISDGDLIEVDGEAGRVRKIKKGSL